MKVCITASAHVRNSEMCCDEWISALEKERLASGADIIISHDSWKQPNLNLPKDWKVFDYDAQKRELGEELFELSKQFHKNCSIKNFGLWYAYKNNYDAVILIDSDCIISPGFVEEHVKHLNTKGDGWDNPIKNCEGGFYSRGFPYIKREMKKWFHLGLWSNEPDLYGQDRVGKEVPKGLRDLVNAPEYVSNGSFFPMSGMNVSFIREALPYMLFLPVFYFEGQRFNRHDDIWGGYILQKIALLKNTSFSYGTPYVYHHTEVDAEADAREEVAMIKYENDFYRLVNKAISYQNVDEDSSQEKILSTLVKELQSEEKFKPIADAFLYQIKAFSNL